MKQNKHWPILAAAAIAGLAVALAACTGPAPGAAQAGDTAAQQAAARNAVAWNAGERSVSPSGIDLAWIPAGTFTMGSPDDEIGRWPEEGPRRQVTISEGFWMSVHPVTQTQWQAVMGANPSWFSENPAAGETQERRPVEQVSWYDALVFANRLSILEGLTPVYSINGSTNPDDWGDTPNAQSSATWDAAQIVAGSTGWRLPTEAQWEHAARAGTTAAFSNGAGDWQNQAGIDSIGWFDFNAGGMTREAGIKQPNPWGLYDIHGNVMEWVWDWFAEYPSHAENDPTGASFGTYRSLRGGSWGISAWSARSASRDNAHPSLRSNTLGLRLVRP
ncbi:MAG: formylglycine-generating enzyme family protein [Spirochaetes bacterium]|nr:formylglycine-generating enzyme family protein [Spirochaetota bacterium]